jgi:hypothetical protein
MSTKHLDRLTDKSFRVIALTVQFSTMLLRRK